MGSHSGTLMYSTMLSHSGTLMTKINVQCDAEPFSEWLSITLSITLSVPEWLSITIDGITLYISVPELLPIIPQYISVPEWLSMHYTVCDIIIMLDMFALLFV